MLEAGPSFGLEGNPWQVLYTRPLGSAFDGSNVWQKVLEIQGCISP